MNSQQPPATPPPGPYYAGYPPLPGGPDPAPAGPAGKRRGLAVPILIGLVALLLIGEGVLLSMTINSQRSLERSLTAQKRQAATDTEDQTVDGALTPPTFDALALQAKLKSVKDADAAADAALSSWRNVQGTKFGTLHKALQRCYYLVDQYNRAAAPYSAQVLAGLPPRIDLASPSTDCSRHSLASI